MDREMLDAALERAAAQLLLAAEVDPERADEMRTLAARLQALLVTDGG